MKLQFWFTIVTGLVFIPAIVFGADSKSVKETLRNRCLAAIESSEVPAKRNLLKETVHEAPGGHYLFMYDRPEGGTYICQICDEVSPDVECGILGLRLALREKEEQPARDLPAEMDRKCVFYLQNELTEGSKIDREMVQRTRVTPNHTDTRWVYQMHLDDQEYRCVIRKSDGNFRVEQRQGEDEWRGLVAGMMF